MSVPECIDRDELRAFSLGRVDDDRVEQINAHLVACPVCEETAASYDDTSDSLIASVREAARDDVPESAAASSESSVLRDALVRSLGRMPDSSNEPNRSDTAGRIVERIRDYELVEQLGFGGMGTVYRAIHTRLEREVALKLLPARRLRDTAAVARFEREMKAIGRLDHPAIVRATDAGIVDGAHFLAMDYIEGVDLSKLVRLNGPLDVASACEAIRQAALGLQYAHEQDLIHRDVKPSNLMLDRRGEVRILDLGLALFGAASEAVDELTTVGQLMGTLDYMAPEQGDNSHDVDGRADVYSLGATLFKLLTGTAPYESAERRTPLAKMKALATIDAPSLADRSDDLPLELIEIVNRTLSRDADDRFATAAEVADALEPFCAGHRLIELADHGQALAKAAIDAEIEPSIPATIPPFVRGSDRLGAPNDASPRKRKAAFTWLRWLILPVVLAAGFVIWLQTDNGTILIECVDDKVLIEIRRGEEVVEERILSVGRNELTVRTGRYEIVLPKKYDALKVEDGSIELLRGEVKYARIAWRPEIAEPPVGAVVPPSPRVPQGMRVVSVDADQPVGSSHLLTSGEPQPVFSGKTFDQWEREVLTERNPEELERAVNALCVLGRGYRDREAAEAVLQILEPYPLDSLPRRVNNNAIVTGEEKLVASAIRQLRRLRSRDILEPVIEALRNDSVLLRRLVIEWLAEPPHGAGQALPYSLVGTPDPLREALLTSPEYIDTVLELWDELPAPSQHSAFMGFSNRVRGPRTEPKLIARLEELVKTPESPFHIKAARLIAEIHPRPELAESFLKALENQAFENPERVNPLLSQAWWSNELDAWVGLARLDGHAAASAERIVALLESGGQHDSLDQMAFITLPSPNHRGYFRIPISRRLLIYELLGRLGPDVPSRVKQVIVASMRDYFGVAPDFTGEFGFEATRPEFVLDHNELTSRPPENVAPPGVPIDADEQAALTASTLNAAALALQRITGSPVPYVDTKLVHMVKRPGAVPVYAAATGDPRGAADQNNVAFLPTLVTYRGKRFEEWCAAAENLAETPFEQLESILGGAILLRESGRGTQVATTAIARVLDHILTTQKFYVDGEQNAAPSNLAMAAYDALRTSDLNDATQTATATVLRGSDQARWWVVDRLANARTESGHSCWPYASEMSDSLNRSTEFTVAFFDQFKQREWVSHSSGLKRALLQLAWRFVTTDGRAQQSTLDAYMRRLLDDDDPFVRAEAAVITARLSLTSIQVVSDELRARLLDILMTAIEQTPEGVELADLVVALSEMSGKLQDSTAERILALIQKDCAAEKGPRPFLMQMMSDSPRSPARSVGASDYSGPENTLRPRVAGGLPGGAPVWALVSSRRLLLLYALKVNPPSDADTRNEFGEALAKLVPLPVRSFSEGQGPLKDLRSRWVEGHRVIGSQPADAETEAKLFIDAVIGTAIKWLPSERASELLFPQDANGMSSARP